MTEFYTERELDLVQAYIENTYGMFESVFHEVVSPDIHVDICVIPPVPERNYYTLVTLGMGAHRMNIPGELAGMQLERAELAISLPSDWKIDSEDERWYWPIRWLKILARLPIEEDSWLGWGHTVSNPGQLPFAENTGFAGMILLNLDQSGHEKRVCRLPNGDEVNFYDMVPLYREEVDYKCANGADELLRLFECDPEKVCIMPVDLNRKNVCISREKVYAIKPEEMECLLTDWPGVEGCLATDRITVDGMPVGYCYREEPEENCKDWDSGWRFMAGDESDAYMDDPGCTSIYTLNAICNYDMEVLPILNSPYGTAFERNQNGELVRLRNWEEGQMPEQKSLLGPAEIQFLEDCVDEADGYFGKMAAYLDEFIQTGVREGRFTERQAREDLQIALWYSYAYNNLDEYRWYYSTVQWMPYSEKYARGCGAWYYRYSVALVYCGRLRDALDYAERGILEEPDYPWIWLQAAKLRCHFGDKEGALAAVERGLSLEPGDYEFLTLRQEIEAGRSLEEMEFHYIDAEADQDLQDGLNPDELSKRAAIRGICLNEDGLNQFQQIFQPIDWEADAPFCSFTMDADGYEVEMVFCMNQAAVSKLDPEWLVSCRELVRQKAKMHRFKEGVTYALRLATVSWDGITVMLTYEDEEGQRILQTVVEADGEERDLDESYDPIDEQSNGLPGMIKLYKQNGDEIHYAEVWIDDDIVTEHIGVLGDTGEVTECRLDAADGWQDYLTGFLKAYYEDGYDEWPEEDFFWLVVQYPIEPVALKEGEMPNLPPADERLRETSENLLNETLGWTGLGIVDGWEVGPSLDGSGRSVLNLYCIVVDGNMAVQTILRALQNEMDRSGLKIAVKMPMDAAYALVYSDDGSQDFSL